MRVKETSVYSFDELSDRAKESARDWYRSGNDDPDRFEHVLDDAATVCSLLGIQLATRTVRLMNGSTRQEPVIYFSGFSSQGDGACFAGQYFYRAGSVRAIRAYAPTDTDLQAIAETLQNLQRRHFYKLSATLTHIGRDAHEYSVTIDVSCDHCYRDDDCASDLADALRDVMRWIYRQLEQEDEFHNSNDTVDESIRANEYEFDEDGDRA